MSTSLLVKIENKFLKEHLGTIVLFYYALLGTSSLVLEPFGSYLSEHIIVTGILGFAAFLIIPAILIKFKNKKVWLIIDQNTITFAKIFSRQPIKNFERENIFSIGPSVYKHEGFSNLGKYRRLRSGMYEGIILPPTFKLNIVTKEGTEYCLAGTRKLLRIANELGNYNYLSAGQKENFASSVQAQLTKIKKNRINIAIILIIMLAYGIIDYYYIHAIFPK